MIRKTLALGALLLSLIIVGAPPSSAGGGPSDYADCIVTVDPSSFQAGDTVTVSGEDLEPSFTTTIEFDGVEVGTATTDATGAFSVDVTIPSDAAEGAHTISATCDAAGNISSTDVSVTVSSSVANPGGPLPRTGSDSTEPLVVAGVLALLAGVAFVVVARRRKSHAGV